MKPEKEWELGLRANCWFCHSKFTKMDYCKQCGYYKCPKCGKCGCNLSDSEKAVVDECFRTLAPILAQRSKLPIK